MVLGLFFGALPIYCGIRGIDGQLIDPMPRWDGTAWFGAPLDGVAAVVAGCSFICMGLVFIATSLSFCKCAKDRRVFAAAPWLFLGLFAILYLSVPFLR